MTEFHVKNSKDYTVTDVVDTNFHFILNNVGCHDNTKFLNKKCIFVHGTTVYGK